MRMDGRTHGPLGHKAGTGGEGWTWPWGGAEFGSPHLCPPPALPPVPLFIVVRGALAWRWGHRSPLPFPPSPSGGAAPAPGLTPPWPGPALTGSGWGADGGDPPPHLKLDLTAGGGQGLGLAGGGGSCMLHPLCLGLDGGGPPRGSNSTPPVPLYPPSAIEPPRPQSKPGGAQLSFAAEPPHPRVPGDLLLPLGGSLGLVFSGGPHTTGPPQPLVLGVLH